MSFWLVVTAVIALIWLIRHIELTYTQIAEPPLQEGQFDGAPNPAPRVSVLVAAKDEEANIELCLQSILQWDYPNFQLIVIDDRSSDRTAERARRVLEGDPRAQFLEVDHLPEGWAGKCNAMHMALPHADGDYLLFIDADVRQESQQTLSLAVRLAQAQKVDFLTILPALETHGFWESVVQPVCTVVLLYWLKPRRVNRPGHWAAYANGAFMMLSRQCYQAIGGHDRSRRELNEDIHMARLTKRAGMKLYMTRSRGLFRSRMYEGLRATWRGWTRIFYGTFGNYWIPAISMTLLTILSVQPYVALVVAASMGHRLLLMLSSVAVLLQIGVMIRFYLFCRVNPFYALFYCLGAMCTVGVLGHTLIKLSGQPITWRATQYAHDHKPGSS